MPKGEDRTRGRVLTRKGGTHTGCPFGRVLVKGTTVLVPVYGVAAICAILPEPRSAPLRSRASTAGMVLTEDRRQATLRACGELPLLALN